MKNLILGIFILNCAYSWHHNSPPNICGIQLEDELSHVYICNSSDQPFDISRYSISVRKVPYGILTYKIPEATVIQPDSSVAVEVPFLDFPFTRKGKEKYRRYYLFDKDDQLVSTFRISRFGG